MDEQFDILINNATIVDGINKSHKGSIGIKGERVTSVGKVSGDAKKVMDATDLIAMPGFIDNHSHADRDLLWFRGCENSIMQGCTTVVAGQCGGSPAPLNEYIRPPSVIIDELHDRIPFLYHRPSPILPIDTVNDMLKEKYGWTINWRTMEEFFKVVEEKGISINYTPLVGHGTIRYAVMGKDYKRYSTNTELTQIKELIHQAMEEGCIGISTGLDYDPDVFAKKSDLNECVAIVKDYGGIYAPHWRRTGRRQAIAKGAGFTSPLQGIIEVIETCRKTGVRLNIAHLAPGYHTIPPMSPAIGEVIAKETLAPINEALEEGLEVSFDTIPYPLHRPLPFLCGRYFTQWLRLLGSRERLAQWLKVDEFRKKAWEEIETGKLFQRVVINPCINPDWAKNITISKHKNKKYIDKTLDEVAGILGSDPWNTLCDLIVEDPDAMGTQADYRGIEEEVKPFFKHRVGVVGLDIPIHPIDYEVKSPPYDFGSPTRWSGYPIFLIRYVRDEGFLTIEEAAQKCSTLPAKIHNIKDRGVIKVGSYADLVLIDLPRLRVVGDVVDPRRYPEGIEYVLVNGTIVAEKGKHTGARPGAVLKRKS